jgi:hypothetical protein
MSAALPVASMHGRAVFARPVRSLRLELWGTGFDNLPSLRFAAQFPMLKLATHGHAHSGKRDVTSVWARRRRIRV